MPLSNLETGGIARCLAQVADRSRDHVDSFFEVLSETGVSGPSGALESESRSESGLAVRLLREGRSWLASSDGISPALFSRAVARVARARPSAVAPPPRSLVGEALRLEDPSELAGFVDAVELAIKRRHATFPIEWDLRSHRRHSRVVGAMLSPEQQEEAYYSCVARTPRSRWGTLLADLEGSTVENVAESLTAVFRGSRATPVATARGVDVVLGPAATAVLLHEAVAHALETDTLALTGQPAAAAGVELGSELLGVLDDPAGAAERVRRSADDEGMPVVKRWLLRSGVVEQPLADLFVGASSSELIPGAARRGSRHLAPVPRSTHLELLAGSSSLEELVADCGQGLFVRELSRGHLDPLSGELWLDFPYARRIERGSIGDSTGPGRLAGSVAATLAGVRAVGGDTTFAGAGWCAKGGHRLPVWARAPSVLIGGLDVSP